MSCYTSLEREVPRGCREGTNIQWTLFCWFGARRHVVRFLVILRFTALSLQSEKLITKMSGSRRRWKYDVREFGENCNGKLKVTGDGTKWKIVIRRIFDRKIILMDLNNSAWLLCMNFSKFQKYFKKIELLKFNYYLWWMCESRVRGRVLVIHFLFLRNPMEFFKLIRISVY